MRTTLAALAGAGAAFASYTPDSYSAPAPPAYEDALSSSSSSSAYVAGTSSSVAHPSTGTSDFPSCWASCFQEAGVSSPEETCGNSDLSECIEESCSSEEAASYNSWLAGECGSSSTSSHVVGPTGSISLSHGPSGYPVSSSLSGYPHGPSSYPHGGSPSGYVPSSSGYNGGYGNCTTTYSSVCTETETLIYRDTTEYAPTTITHVFTTSLPADSCSGVPYPVTSSSSTPSSPEEPSGGYGGSEVVTDFTTIYTTVCPATETGESDGETYTKIYETTSQVTSVYPTTVTIPANGGGYGSVPTPTSAASPVTVTPAGDYPSDDSDLPTEPAGGNGGSPSEYTSIKPVTRPFTYGDWTSFYTDFETVTLTSYVTETATEVGSVPTGSPPGGFPDGPTDGSPEGPTASAPGGGYGGHLTTQTQVYETDITTAYTTVCPATDSDGITTSTVTTTSSISLTFTVTVTDYPEATSSSVGGGEQPPYPNPTSSSKIDGYPTGGYGSGTVSSKPVDSTSSDWTGPTGSPEQPTIPSCWAKCFAEDGITSERELCGDIEVETCIKAECPIDSYNAYESWLDDYCGIASTSSGVVGPTGTSDYPQPTGSGYPHPSGSSSADPQPTGSSSSSGSGYPQPTGSGYPNPTGTGAPQPSGTGAPTSTSSTCSLPTPTESCKRCDGQPGTDKFCGLDINTNIYEDGNAPITCNTVEYEWEITTGNMSPDGVERWGILVNGQSPGPMLEANWGDEIIVHVKNSMPETDLNGTTIHWHGIHQKGTSEFDGTPSLTQCPIAPGETFTYKFRATQYGSSWYHSHFALQAYDGLFGPMVIHGPVQEGYEYDGEEFIALQDWSHVPLNFMYHRLELVSNGQRSSPTLENGLINGMNTFNGGGERWSMTVTKGKTYRLRVLNAAVQSTFKFYIDGHKFKVIAADFVPIEPYETDMINVNNGQRYDVIFTADQPSANYWMRSDNQGPCSNITNGNDIKAIVHYDDAPEGEPQSTPYTYQPECIDEAPENLVPVVPWNAGASSDTIDKDTVIQPNGGTPNLFKWTLSGTAFFSQWSDPTLYSIYEDGTVPTYSGNLAIREDNLGEWIYVVIDSPIPLPHPIHLHGHDFLVLDQGVGLYNAATASLNLNNPPRRDTAIMPFQPGTVGGYLVVAFYTDNPGVWLMHCHIGWHNAMGFALQIIEGLEDIKDTVEFACQMEENCEAWHAYAEEYGVVVSDSGV